MSAIYDAIYQFLLFINTFVGSWGWSIIIFTFIFRGITLAFTYKSLKSMGKMRALNGELKALQKQYKDDPQALQLAQLELYKKHNLNPMSGCLPQILQLVMLIIVYQVLIRLVKTDGLADTQLWWFNLVEPDGRHILPFIAAGTQLFLSIMTLPGGETPDIVPNSKKERKAIKELNKKEEDQADMAATMQKQMLFLMPVMTGFIAWKIQAGLVLYWVASTVFSIGQQYFISGWGGITIYAQRLGSLIKHEQ